MFARPTCLSLCGATLTCGINPRGLSLGWAALGFRQTKRCYDMRKWLSSWPSCVSHHQQSPGDNEWAHVSHLLSDCFYPFCFCRRDVFACIGLSDGDPSWERSFSRWPLGVCDYLVPVRRQFHPEEWSRRTRNIYNWSEPHNRCVHRYKRLRLWPGLALTPLMICPQSSCSTLSDSITCAVYQRVAAPLWTNLVFVHISKVNPGIFDIFCRLQ